jgi:hypothetical protein
MTVGYFVYCRKYSPMVLGDDGLLYFGQTVTFFPTRAAASAAVRRTLKDRPTFKEEFGELIIVRLSPEPEHYTVKGSRGQAVAVIRGSYTVIVDREQAVVITKKGKPGTA